jgi:hypothetical protein
MLFGAGIAQLVKRRAGRPGCYSGRGKKFVSSPQRLALGPIQPPSQWVAGALGRGKEAGS